jgi:hypothetical protein
MTCGMMKMHGVSKNDELEREDEKCQHSPMDEISDNALRHDVIPVVVSALVRLEKLLFSWRVSKSSNNLCLSMCVSISEAEQIFNSKIEKCPETND